jgi:predicted RNase H-like nuclease
MSQSEVEQIEAALGLALCTARNPTGCCVEHVDGGYRIYDDWTDDTFERIEDALEHARKCAADARQAP